MGQLQSTFQHNINSGNVPNSPNRLSTFQNNSKSVESFLRGQLISHHSTLTEGALMYICV